MKTLSGIIEGGIISGAAVWGFYHYILPITVDYFGVINYALTGIIR